MCSNLLILLISSCLSARRRRPPCSSLRRQGAAARFARAGWLHQHGGAAPNRGVRVRRPGLYATAWPLVERPLRDFQIGARLNLDRARKPQDQLLLAAHGHRSRATTGQNVALATGDVFQTIEGRAGLLGQHSVWVDDGQISA